jgi:hypothetical protein
MDRQAKSRGYRRHPDETLHAFAERISRPAGGGSQLTAPSSQLKTDNGQLTNWIADWYLAYAGLRYRQELDPGRIEQLRLIAQKLQPKPPERHRRSSAT